MTHNTEEWLEAELRRLAVETGTRIDDYTVYFELDMFSRVYAAVRRGRKIVVNPWSMCWCSRAFVGMVFRHELCHVRQEVAGRLAWLPEPGKFRWLDEEYSIEAVSSMGIGYLEMPWEREAVLASLPLDGELHEDELSNVVYAASVKIYEESRRVDA